MALADLNSMLTELPNDKAGENCEYEPLYMELETLAVPVAQQEMGDSVVEGRDADFRKLQKSCEELWLKTRDLRVAAYFTIADFCNNGLRGLEQGVQLIDYLLVNMWDEVWPRLDPDDDNDPTERINSLSMISPRAGAFSDPIEFMNHVRSVKLVDSLPYSLRDYLNLLGILDGGELEDPVLMQAQLRNIPYEELQQNKSVVEHILELLQHISSLFNEKVGQNGYINFETLENELNYLKKFYESYAVEDNQVSPTQEENVPNGEEQTATQDQNKNIAKSVGKTTHIFNDVQSLVIDNRNDALLLIRKCADYFSKAEPTSPLPYLLNRALRMANMNFVDILAEIDQNSLEKVKEQLGVLPPTE